MPPKRIKDGNPTPATGPGAPCTPPLWGFRALPPASSAVVRKAPIAAANRPRTPLFAPLALPRAPAPILGASATVLEVAEALEAVRVEAAGEILAAKVCVAATAGEIVGAAKAVVVAASETFVEAAEVWAAGAALELAEVEAAGEILTAKVCVAATAGEIVGTAKAVVVAASETFVEAAEDWAAGEALEPAEVEAAGEILAAKV